MVLVSHSQRNIENKTNRLGNITDICSFCNIEIETISHLIYRCPLAEQVLIEIFNYFDNLWVDIVGVPSKKDFIFGHRKQNIYSPVYVFIMHVQH